MINLVRSKRSVEGKFDIGCECSKLQHLWYREQGGRGTNAILLDSVVLCVKPTLLWCTKNIAILVCVPVTVLQAASGMNQSGCDPALVHAGRIMLVQRVLAKSRARERDAQPLIVCGLSRGAPLS